MVHIITRLGEFRIQSPAERDEFLRRMGRAISQSDWIGLAFAVMGNHCHTVHLSGHDESARITRSCHTGFASWLNASQLREGRVMRCRPTIKQASDTSGIARLIAYVHNNPAKINPGTVARDSDWTSHRAYLGLISAPSWINVDLGLELAGFEPTSDGRARFDEYTNLRLSDPEADLDIGDEDPRALRAKARAAAGRPVELATPNIDEVSVRYPILSSAGSPYRFHRVDDPIQVIEAVAKAMGLPAVHLRQRGQRRAVVSARRVAVLVWRFAGRPVVAMTRALGISESSACYLQTSASGDETGLAIELARLLHDAADA